MGSTFSQTDGINNSMHLRNKIMLSVFFLNHAVIVHAAAAAAAPWETSFTCILAHYVTGQLRSVPKQLMILW